MPSSANHQKQLLLEMIAIVRSAATAGTGLPELEVLRDYVEKHFPMHSSSADEEFKEICRMLEFLAVGNDVCAGSGSTEDYRP